VAPFREFSDIAWSARCSGAAGAHGHPDLAAVFEAGSSNDRPSRAFSIVWSAAMSVKKDKSGEREVFENGILVGWHAWSRDRVGDRVEAFIPRRDEDIEADRRNRTLH